MSRVTPFAHMGRLVHSVLEPALRDLGEEEAPNLPDMLVMDVLDITCSAAVSLTEVIEVSELAAKVAIRAMHRLVDRGWITSSPSKRVRNDRHLTMTNGGARAMQLYIDAVDRRVGLFEDGGGKIRMAADVLMCMQIKEDSDER